MQNTDNTALLSFVNGYKISRMIGAMAELGIADMIEPEGSSKVADLAAACKIQLEPLVRILRALTTIRVFQYTEDGLVRHSSLSRLLRSDDPDSLRHAARALTAPGQWRAWEAFDVVFQGKLPQEDAWGISRFQFLQEHPEEARLFDSYMAHLGDDRHREVARAYDFAHARRIVDVGGGNGETIRQILDEYPDLQGILFDRAHVIGAIPPSALADGRITVETGDFFQAVPPGGDVYILSRILHNWPDEDALRILETCRQAMNRSAKLLVVEMVLPADPLPEQSRHYFSDVQMMVMFKGARERTQAEFRRLFESGGFQQTQVVSTPSTQLLELQRSR
jgi:hypothetical protein